MKLYELTAEYLATAEKLESLDLDEQTVRDTLDGASGGLEEKMFAVAAMIRNMDTLADSIAQAEKSMKARREAMEKKIDWMENYLKENMWATNRLKIENAYYRISVKNNPPSVIVDDWKTLPSEYLIIPTTPDPKPNKTLIKSAIESGKDLEGCRVIQTTRLEIK